MDGQGTPPSSVRIYVAIHCLGCGIPRVLQVVRTGHTVTGICPVCRGTVAMTVPINGRRPIRHDAKPTKPVMRLR